MNRKLRLTCGAVSGWLCLAATALSLGCQGPSINVVGVDLGSGTQLDLNGAAAESYFRLGHFLVGAPPFDICVKGSGDASFTGPLLRVQTQRPGGVSYANVTTYLTVAPTSYMVRAVPGAATDCNTSLLNLPDLALTPLALGHHYTVAASGVLTRTATLKFNLIEDDLSTQGGQARLRFINAASEFQSTELGFGSGAQYVAQLTGATYGNLGFSGGQAYLTTSPLTNATVAVRQSGVNSDALVVAGKVNVAVGTVATAVITGSSTDAFTPLSLVLCNDSAPAVSGLASCTELP